MDHGPELLAVPILTLNTDQFLPCKLAINWYFFFEIVLCLTDLVTLKRGHKLKISEELSVNKSKCTILKFQTLNLR